MPFASRPPQVLHSSPSRSFLVFFLSSSSPFFGLFSSSSHPPYLLFISSSRPPIVLPSSFSHPHLVILSIFSCPFFVLMSSNPRLLFKIQNSLESHTLLALLSSSYRLLFVLFTSFSHPLHVINKPKFVRYYYLITSFLSCQTSRNYENLCANIQFLQIYVLIKRVFFLPLLLPR